MISCHRTVILLPVKRNTYIERGNKTYKSLVNYTKVMKSRNRALRQSSSRTPYIRRSLASEFPKAMTNTTMQAWPVAAMSAILSTDSPSTQLVKSAWTLAECQDWRAKAENDQTSTSQFCDRRVIDYHRHIKSTARREVQSTSIMEGSVTDRHMYWD